MGIGRRIEVGIQRGAEVQIEVDGKPVVAYEGETIAAALTASGQSTFRHTARHGAPRGVFCGMGVCFDCLMTVNEVPNVRTCVTTVEPGMRVRTQQEGQWQGGR